MIPLLILPFVAALALQRFWPRAYRALRQRQSISFYLWAVSLTIVMGNTTSFLIRQDSSRYGDELLLAGASLVACVCQFVIGRRIGRKYDLKISGAQGLGQKNTVLAIWMAQTYLLPIASVARPPTSCAERHQQLATVEEKKERGRAANLKPSIRSFSGPGPDRKVLS